MKLLDDKPATLVQKLAVPVGGFIAGASITEGAEAGALFAFPEKFAGKNTQAKLSGFAAAAGTAVIVAGHFIASKTFAKAGKARAMLKVFSQSAMVGVAVSAVSPFISKATDWVAIMVLKLVSMIAGKKTPPIKDVNAPAKKKVTGGGTGNAKVLEMATRGATKVDASKLKGARGGSQILSMGGGSLLP